MIQSGAPAALAIGRLIEPLADPTDWLGFTGRLHPLLLHLPIGLFAAVALLEVASWRSRAAGSARRLVTWAGALTAVLAAGSGWLLAEEGGQPLELLDEHRWQGVGVAVLFVLVAALERAQPSRRLVWSRRAALLVCAGALYAAGHHGGMLTHGETFLSAKAPGWLAPLVGHESGGGAGATPTGERDPVAAAALDALARSCLRCHGPDKAKGGLRLDDPADLSTVVVPGDAPASELFRRVTLRPTHPEFMPTEGAPLSDEEVLALMDWINAGASLTVLNEARAEQEQADAQREGELDDLRAATGAIVEDLGDGALRVDFSRGRGALTEESVAALAPVAERVVELSLAGRELGTAVVNALPPSLPRLERLRAERSDLDDEALAALLERASGLRELNVHTTRVGSLAAVRRLERLERGWFADTRVAADDLERLRAERPTAQLFGSLALPTPTADAPAPSAGH
ncbi:Planctomycete cytochrome C [Planctomycetes bacterium Pla163]|uniref:Planctomycete cytochrome C n=1 Tax=Rohdeia mirabilis TaxID=2528008 RepID=A0A518D2H3_9BACT|nr:Planctomycete cytochrome C [Planctomycetes bacterium Pla163]